jgi:hypothetical protein
MNFCLGGPTGFGELLNEIGEQFSESRCVLEVIFSKYQGLLKTFFWFLTLDGWKNRFWKGFRGDQEQSEKKNQHRD